MTDWIDDVDVFRDGGLEFVCFFSFAGFAQDISTFDPLISVSVINKGIIKDS